MSLYPQDNTCKRCEQIGKGNKCDCACHNDSNLAKWPHIFHLRQESEPDERFKLKQLEHLRKRFPELGEEKILEMYNQNLF